MQHPPSHPTTQSHQVQYQPPLPQPPRPPPHQPPPQQPIHFPPAPPGYSYAPPPAQLYYQPGVYLPPPPPVPTPTLNTPQPQAGQKRKANTATSDAQKSSRTRTGPQQSNHDATQTAASYLNIPELHDRLVQHETAASSSSNASGSNSLSVPLHVIVSAPSPTKPPPTQPRETGEAASDIWWHYRGLDTENTKEQLYPLPPDPPRSRTKPSGAKSFGCRICYPSDEHPGPKSWTAFKNGANQTTSMRKHLAKEHTKEYFHARKVHNLKKAPIPENWKVQAPTDDEDSDTPRPTSSRRRQPAEVPTSSGMLDRLLRWIVTDDQAINVIENPELRSLLVYCGGGTFTDDDIPHRTTLTQAIFKYHEREENNIKALLAQSAGDISMTSDIWTDSDQKSYMAITAHLTLLKDDGLDYLSRLIAFRPMPMSHTGKNMAAEFIHILKDYGILNKIGRITLDNASNNNTMMEHLQEELRKVGIDFDVEENRIRCFPHVVNISVQTFLEAIEKGPSDFIAATMDTSYAEALSDKPLKTIRDLINACRASGLRRQRFDDLIQSGNSGSLFKGPDGRVVKLGRLQLLRDVSTRWSSTHQMIERAIELYPAIALFLLSEDQMSIRKLLLGSSQLKLLKDISQILGAPARVQQLLSFEKTPALSVALPSYEWLLRQFKNFRVTIKELAWALNPAIDKLEEYVVRSRTCSAHALAMMLNPTIKLTWMDEHWTEDEATNARKTMVKAMIKHAKRMEDDQDGDPNSWRALHSMSRSPSPSPSSLIHSRRSSLGRPPSRASSAGSLAKGFAALDAFDSTTRLSDSSVSPQPTTPASLESPASLQPAENPRQQAERLNAAVNAELDRYLEQEKPGLSDTVADPLIYWETYRDDFPVLFRVALDILPCQSSSVPCERVFSSSAETVTKRRNRLSPALVGAIQQLKYTYKAERLDFSRDSPLTAADVDLEMSGGGLSAASARKLLAENKIDDLDRMANCSTWDAHFDFV